MSVRIPVCCFVCLFLFFGGAPGLFPRPCYGAAPHSGSILSQVNTAPQFVTNPPASIVLDEDQSGSFLFSITDGESPAANLTVSAVADNTLLFPPGSLTPGGSGGNRSVLMVPAANANGSATVTVTVSDGELSQSRSVTVTFRAINDAPGIAFTGPFPTEALSGQTFPLLGVVLSDPDGPGVIASLTLNGFSTTGGRLWVQPPPGVNVVVQTTPSLQVTGLLSEIQKIFSSPTGVVFKVEAGYVGEATIDMTLNDLGNIGASGPLSRTASWNVQVFANGFARWCNPFGITSETDDADGDHVPALVEYALDLSPVTPDAARVPAFTMDAAGMHLSAVRRVDPLLLVEVETAFALPPDARGWSADPAFVSHGSNSLPGGGFFTEIFGSATPPGGENMQFFRLSARLLSAGP